jgi:hypothetical protein
MALARLFYGALTVTVCLCAPLRNPKAFTSVHFGFLLWQAKSSAV